MIPHLTITVIHSFHYVCTFFKSLKYINYKAQAFSDKKWNPFVNTIAQNFDGGKVWRILTDWCWIIKIFPTKILHLENFFAITYFTNRAWLGLSRYVGTWNFEVLCPILDKKLKDPLEDKEVRFIVSMVSPSHPIHLRCYQGLSPSSITN